MTLVALTQEPEVKVRLAMIGKWCLPECEGRHLKEVGHWRTPVPICTVYKQDCSFSSEGPYNGFTLSRTRCPACIAAHGGAE